MTHVILMLQVKIWSTVQQKMYLKKLQRNNGPELIYYFHRPP